MVERVVAPMLTATSMAHIACVVFVRTYIMILLILIAYSSCTCTSLLLFLELQPVEICWPKTSTRSGFSSRLTATQASLT